MTKRNWGLLIIFFLLTGVFGILLSRNASKSSLEVDEDLFAVEDTAAIQRLELQQPGGVTQELRRQQQGWELNRTYRADGQLIRLLLNVLQDVEVKRPVAQTQQEAVQNSLRENGTRLRIYDATGLMKEFYAGGNEQEQISFFLDNATAYVMELPGYASYISGIFALNENNFRDRTLFSSNYYNLQQIKVTYPQTEESVTINYSGQQLVVEEVPQPDSTQLLGFLSLFEDLQAVGYVNAREYPELDSLLQQPPVAEITVTNLQNPQGKQLHIYAPTPGDRFRLAYLPQDQQAVLLDERLARMLLIDRAQLNRQEE